ncbi:ferrochelatase [bacterium (Candidatus Blackallbacteria) CG17_big_fil_post_rev_8_21_14_2_50_48_46]|uniref:Ferrochelatase n=1 Tax=bacterium (Candidatus Blackallbacteria) CG17_big_fil_post_rev_8_21_14_2_50_48_46 TaxID=2014261 RepID=A0A2M7G300_9BACT|nr:MAG: ferrochelatase [bacterium (Candidatus Blackallbacteria) CG18_big_fil_WC_8_21_14_2_50_49_26]PIW16206.1 MAG: ferrochelatase [bacterium (Candidatus Blackallbacteria) CG17_big_fil_post_rev_8_21_14_2_50_48_46]PIW49911.1 MAG: ferrochelatase [bacterium (Candidatus Blackallbacteria) CG13_big_fil_rev_8_21_14_2_50_49_14]
MQDKPGVLLVNLGSPDSPQVPDVRRYLDEFLMDERVIDIPWPLRALLVKGIILNTRPAKSAEAYAKIWTEAGSPLVHISEQVQQSVQTQSTIPVELAMRYGRPSIRQGLEKLQQQGVNRLLLIPLYPHYAMSSFETVVEKVKAELKALNYTPTLKVFPPFYNHPRYIEALVENTRPWLEEPYDLLVFSYHGIPVRHLVKADASGKHCQKVPDCCNTPSEAHKTCYRAQILRTTEAFVKAANIPQDKYRVTFQSRLGRTPWLQPYTDLELEVWPAQGFKRIRVMCPAFVSDCLETLEEIAMRGKESFLAAGGEDLQLIPCLNTHPLWLEVLGEWVEAFAQEKVNPVVP